MPPIRTQDVQRAKASYEQKKASQKIQEAFINDMATSRNALSETINEMAEKHNKYTFSPSRNDILTACIPEMQKLLQHSYMPALES